MLASRARWDYRALVRGATFVSQGWYPCWRQEIAQKSGLREWLPGSSGGHVSIPKARIAYIHDLKSVCPSALPACPQALGSLYSPLGPHDPLHPLVEPSHTHALVHHPPSSLARELCL